MPLTMIEYQILYITHNLGISMMSVGRDGLQYLTVFLVNCGGLGMQDKRDGQ